MKVCFISRKILAGTTVGIILVCACLGFFMLYFSNTSEASKIKEAIYQGKSGIKAVAINVNVDWGEEYIPDMLKLFQENKAKATFFVTGQWAEKHQELLKQMHSEGHSIQNHGYKHVHFNTLSVQEATEQIKKTEKIIFDVTGTTSKYFATPYGEVNRQILAVATSLNYDLIMWSVDTIDWQRPSPETIVKRVMNKLHNDAIILMHPTEPSVKALPEMLKQINDQGYKIMLVNDLLVPEVKNE